MRFEPVKYNYTTAQVYLPNSSLKEKNAAALKAVGDTELDLLDSNGEPLDYKTGSRPHSAVRATRMHVLQRISKDIVGSEHSLVSAVLRERPRTASPGQYTRAASRTCSSSRPCSTPGGKHQRRPLLLLQKATNLPDPSTISAMLDHRCYPLRHCDLEAARRVQFASMLPPWRKKEQEELLKPVRLEHERLVSKRKEIRTRKSEQKKLAAMVVPMVKVENNSQFDIDDIEDINEANLDSYDEREIRRMTWSFHRLDTQLNEAPHLDVASKDLRKTLIPGSNPPALPFVRTAVSEVMRQDRKEMIEKTPVSVRNVRRKTGSVSLKSKPMYESVENCSSPDLCRKQKLESSAIELQHSVKNLKKSEEFIPVDLVRNNSNVIKMDSDNNDLVENIKLAKMVKELESGCWDQSEKGLCKHVDRESVLKIVKESPVLHSIIETEVSSTIPKPIEIVKERTINQNFKTKSTNNSKKVLAVRENHLQELVTDITLASCGVVCDPLIQIHNLNKVMDKVHEKALQLRQKYQCTPAIQMQSNVKYDINGEDDRLRIASLTKTLTLNTNSEYDRRAKISKEMYWKDEVEKKRRLKKWRQKRWTMLAAGKTMPNLE